MLKALLAHPLTRGLDIDDPRTTHLRLQIIQQKSFLRQIYEEWYRAIAATLPPGEGAVLELGAGGGFMSDLVPDLIASELFYCPNIRAVLDGLRLPFVAKTLRGIVMTDVLHHLPQPRLFFAEATRCVRPGGVVVMIEPWVTPWIWCISQWSALLHYVRVFAIPYGLSVDNDFPYTLSLAEFRAWGALLLLAAWIALALRYSRRFPQVAFATFWFFITLAPESTFSPLAEVVNDHRPYIASSLGLSVLAVWLVDSASRLAGANRRKV